MCKTKKKKSKIKKFLEFDWISQIPLYYHSDSNHYKKLHVK